VQCARKCSGGIDITQNFEDLYNEPNIVNVIKFSIFGWAGYGARMNEKNYLKKKYYAQTLEVNEDATDRNQDELTYWRKTQGSWAVKLADGCPG
jgi:hypothetical protein